MLKKKIIFPVTILLCAALFSACGKKEEEQEMNPEADYTLELERQEDIESDENVESFTADSDFIEKINKYMIPEQSFDISLNDWGEVTFVSCKPMPDADGEINPYTDVSFYLISDEQVIYRFPYVNVLENDTYAWKDNIRQRGMIDLSYDGISFIMFTDVNADGKDDVVIGIFYLAGVGAQGAIPRIEVRIYEDNGNEFVYNQSLCDELWDLPYDTTAGDAKSFLKEYTLMDVTGENQSENSEEWQDAYKEIVRNMDSYLSDPYIARSGSESEVDSVMGFVGIHDFNHDNTPELIIGDLVSVGVFTFEDGKAKKIADLYEPEGWYYISGVYYKNNTVVLVNSGSDGSCYVCFTYDDGDGIGWGEKYLIGIYDEYNHMGAAIINGEVVTEEKFNEQFDLAELLDNSGIPRSRLKKDNGIITALVINAFEKDYEYIVIEDLDLNLGEW